MHHIHGIGFSFNTTKVLYVAEELGLEYEYTELDLKSGQNKTPEHLARHPVGKAPTLTHDGAHLFESGAICRYLASLEGSTLYPTEALERARVDQWMDFFSVHLGRWLSTIQFERVVRAQFALGEPKQDAVDEALRFATKQLAAVDKHLGGTGFLQGARISIADFFAFAYIETTEVSDVSLAPYPNLQRWYDGIKGRPSIAAAKKRLFPS